MKVKRNLFIKRDVFQLRIIQNLLAILISAIVILVLSGILIFYWIPASRHIFEHGGLENPVFGYIFLAMKILSGIISILIIVLAFTIHIIGSRFLGPLKRLIGVIEKAEDSEVDIGLKFRKYDEEDFHFLATSLNQIFRELNEYNTIKSDIRRFNELLKENQKTPQDALCFIEELETRLERSE